MTLAESLPSTLNARNEAADASGYYINELSQRASARPCDSAGACRGQSRPRAKVTSRSLAIIAHPILHTYTTYSFKLMRLFRAKKATL